MANTDVPSPVEVESKICFGIAYFATEADADAYHDFVVGRGHTYVGGWMHGAPCGREPGRDKVDADGNTLYAVTN